MSEEEFIKLLREHKENKAKLKIKLKELRNNRIRLENVKEYETSLTTKFGINQDIHSKNQITDKVLNKIEENDTKRIEIEEKIKELEKEVRELRINIETVEDRLEGLNQKEEEIVKAYFMGGRTYEDIGDNLYKQLYNQTRTGKQIKRIIEIAVNKMINL